ncbi:hypothetical protein L1987_20234 [Smallanthus sonchifolius]|uniref:Uncharacterized protein n=1 Tax=Smallanthus sonchifolius TaxID=185202 RepID=A0ACB9ISG9_9ASTR|nr:hypothetical protein L1987_20234 [Smallanthus sonchifolius]
MIIQRDILEPTTKSSQLIYGAVCMEDPIMTRNAITLKHSPIFIKTILTDDPSKNGVLLLLKRKHPHLHQHRELQTFGDAAEEEQENTDTVSTTLEESKPETTALQITTGKDYTWVNDLRITLPIEYELKRRSIYANTHKVKVIPFNCVIPHKTIPEKNKTEIKPLRKVEEQRAKHTRNERFIYLDETNKDHGLMHPSNFNLLMYLHYSTPRLPVDIRDVVFITCYDVGKEKLNEEQMTIAQRRKQVRRKDTYHCINKEVESKIKVAPSTHKRRRIKGSKNPPSPLKKFKKKIKGAKHGLCLR